jgi:hypothetical protein
MTRATRLAVIILNRMAVEEWKGLAVKRTDLHDTTFNEKPTVTISTGIRDRNKSHHRQFKLMM